MSLRNAATLMAFTLTTLAAHAEDSSAPMQNVMLGGDATMDACSSLGRVSGLKDVAGNFLALRSYPGTQGAMIDKLTNGQELWMCDETENWIGVILPDEAQDCGTSSPIANKAPYAGPCKSGWVYSKFVELEAG